MKNSSLRIGEDTVSVVRAMLRDKAPGVKILWVWAFGTAAVLVTQVVRTRLNDMEKLVNAGEEARPADSVLINSFPNSDEVVLDKEA